MASLTTTQITQAIRRKILEETTDLVSDETVLLNANLAYDDIKYRTFTPDQIKTATITFTDGVGTLPADFGTLYGPGFKSATDKTPFTETSISDFDRKVEEDNITIIEGALHVSPSTTSSLIIRYYPTYDALTTSQNPEVKDYFHELIIYGAMWRILEDMQNEALSEYYREKYEEEFKKKTDAMSQYQEENMGGNEFFTYQRLI
jgi:hypothetical protein